MQRWNGQERPLNSREGSSPVVELATEHWWREEPEQRAGGRHGRAAGSRAAGSRPAGKAHSVRMGEVRAYHAELCGLW